MSLAQSATSKSAIFYIPNGIQIIKPHHATLEEVPREHLHSLAYIPWNETYLEHIPIEYRRFFLSILPKLNARTTDVHTALSVSFVDELIGLSGRKVNRKVLMIALLLHDIGWAQLTPAQIALSLNYSAFTYNEDALQPKRLHASIGADIAQSVLDESADSLHIDGQEKDFIVKLVRFHDQINPWPEKPEPIEYLLLGDADRLWSYTHENFWLDTIRKNTPPNQYIDNITAAIDSYFLTDAGKQIARRLAAERRIEVKQIEDAS